MMADSLIKRSINNYMHVDEIYSLEIEVIIRDPILASALFLSI